MFKCWRWSRGILKNNLQKSYIWLKIVISDIKGNAIYFALVENQLSIFNLILLLLKYEILFYI